MTRSKNAAARIAIVSPIQSSSGVDDAAATLGDVLTFMRVLWAVDHGLRSTSKRMAKRAGVTGPQRLVLRMVGRFPGASAGQLAELLHVHPSTLTGVLARLTRRGLMLRKEDPEDGRRSLFRLTSKGEAVDDLRTGTVEDAVRRVLSRVPASKIAAARDILGDLATELSEPMPESRARRTNGKKAPKRSR